MLANSFATLRGKVVYVVLLTCFVSLMVTGCAFVFYEWYALKDNQATQLTDVSQLLGKQLKRPLLKNSRALAEDELSILQALPSIQSAYLFTDKDRLFSYYRRDAGKHIVPANIKALQQTLDTHAYTEHHLLEGDRLLGKLFVVSDINPIHEIAKGFGLKALLTLIIAMLIAYILGDRLKRTILHPIRDLTIIARKISDEKDYHLRVEMVDIEELAVLIDAFNHMLSVISARSTEIENIKNYLYELIDAISSVLIGIDSEYQVVYFNDAGCKLSNSSLSDALGQNVFHLLPMLAAQEEHIQKALFHQQERQSDRFVVELSGIKRYFQLKVYPLQHDAGAVIQLEDVSKEVEIEARFIQNQKMLSLGGMAAGMAHEINNPLGGIIQGAQNIERRLDLSLPANQAVATDVGLNAGALKDYLEKRQIMHFITGVRQMGNRMAMIVQNMLQFSRAEHSQQTLVSVEGLITSALDVSKNDRQVLRAKINLHIPEDLPQLRCTPAEIQQVLVNLIRNAAQAMSEQENPEPCISIRAEAIDNHFIEIQVKDNGPGIPEAIQSKVFEPFFTTKAPGQGTGLGMSLSYFIIATRHGGEMQLSSAADKGTTFYVRLPVSGLTKAN